MAGFTRRDLLTGGLGALTAQRGTATTAPGGPDVNVVQTAASVERSLVAAYEALVALPVVRTGNPLVTEAVHTTLGHHREHLSAFQSQTTTLAAKVQNAPNPRLQATIAKLLPGAKSMADVVNLAATLEQFATDTYLFDLGVAGPGLRGLLGSVVLAEAQHLAMLRILQLLAETGKERLVALPTELARLPRAAGAVAFPLALHPLAGPDAVVPPDSGAIR